MAKVKLNLSLDVEIKKELAKQALNNSRGVSEHVKELICAEKLRTLRRDK